MEKHPLGFVERQKLLAWTQRLGAGSGATGCTVMEAGDIRGYNDTER